MKEKDVIRLGLESGLGKKEDVRRRAIASGSREETATGGSRPGKPSAKKKVWLTILASAAVLIVTVSCLTGIYVPFTTNGEDAPHALASGSYKELYKALDEYYAVRNPVYAPSFNLFAMMEPGSDGSDDMDSGNKSPAVPNWDGSVTESMAESDSQSKDYSETNIQTAGMDEGDIVKWDAEYIYKLSQNGCSIISIAGGGLTLVSELKAENYLPRELYVQGDTLIMIGEYYEEKPNIGSSNIYPMADICSYYTVGRTDIRVYNIENKAEPALTRRITVDGMYQTSRYDIEENRLYYFVSYYFSYYGDGKGAVPEVYDSAVSEETKMLPAENIYCYYGIPQYHYLLIGRIDIENAAEESLLNAFLGVSGAHFYVSADNIYIADYDHYSAFEKNAVGWMRSTANSYGGTTRVVRISLDTLTHQANTRVAGYIRDRYALDEYEGYLRIASTYNDIYNIKNGVFILNGDTLAEVGKADNLAAGERIYAARFNKTSGSIVTFRETDPYYFFDLSDPQNPKVTAEIKEDGVSHYIHYIGDTGYTLGIGQDTVPNGWGGATVTGLKVSLYKDGVDASIVTVTLPGQYYAELFYEPKALYYEESRGLFGFSFENWVSDAYGYSQSFSQGFILFRFDTENETLALVKTLSNVESSGNHYYSDQYWSFIRRGFRVGETFYTISDKVITAYTMDGFTQKGKLTLYS